MKPYLVIYSPKVIKYLKSKYRGHMVFKNLVLLTPRVLQKAKFFLSNWGHDEDNTKHRKLF